MIVVVVDRALQDRRRTFDDLRTLDQRLHRFEHQRMSGWGETGQSVMEIGRVCDGSPIAMSSLGPPREPRRVGTQKFVRDGGVIGESVV